MSKKYWFKRKRYGWGWVPTTIAGYALIIGWCALVLAPAFFFVNDDNDSATTLIAYIGYVILLSLLLSMVCYKKGPKPKWRWGKTLDDEPDEDW